MKASVSCLAVMAAVISGAAFAQDAPGPTDKKLETAMHNNPASE